MPCPGVHEGKEGRRDLLIDEPLINNLMPASARQTAGFVEKTEASMINGLFSVRCPGIPRILTS